MTSNTNNRNRVSVSGSEVYYRGCFLRRTISVKYNAVKRRFFLFLFTDRRLAVHSRKALKVYKMSTTPAKKTTKPKKVAAHPKYSDMVKTAVGSLKERGGSSRQALLKYIMANFNVGSDAKSVNSHLKVALRNGVKNGFLKQSKGTGTAGSFKLGELPKPKKPAVKKAKKPAAKKPAAKKPAAKKPATKKTTTKTVKKTPVKKAKKPATAKKPAVKKATKPKTPKKTKPAKSPKKTTKAKKPAAKK